MAQLTICERVKGLFYFVRNSVRECILEYGPFRSLYERVQPLVLRPWPI